MTNEKLLRDAVQLITMFSADRALVAAGRLRDPEVTQKVNDWLLENELTEELQAGIRKHIWASFEEMAKEMKESGADEMKIAETNIIPMTWLMYLDHFKGMQMEMLQKAASETKQ